MFSNYPNSHLPKILYLKMNWVFRFLLYNIQENTDLCWGKLLKIFMCSFYYNKIFHYTLRKHDLKYKIQYTVLYCTYHKCIVGFYLNADWWCLHSISLHHYQYRYLHMCIATEFSVTKFYFQWCKAQNNISQQLLLSDKSGMVLIF